MNSWSARYRASLSGSHDTVDTVDTWKGRTLERDECVNTVSSVTPEGEEDDAAERAAIQADPAMPTLGTPERERMNREQAATVKGLLIVADCPRWRI